MRRGTIQKIEGVEAISAIPGVELAVDVREGQKVDKHNLLARVLYVADDVEAAIETIYQIGALLKIINEDDVNIAMHFNDFDQVRSMLAR